MGPPPTLLPGISLGNPSRRRYSLPASPPETPMSGYFSREALTLGPTLPLGNLAYPLSPPATPTRPTADSTPPSAKALDVLPAAFAASASGRRPSQAYEGHHRRTSTQSIIRMALTSRGTTAPILTPSKVMTLVIIVFTAGYLASSFLPAPTFFAPDRPSWAPAPSRNIKKYEDLTSTIGDTAQRKAWSSIFAHRTAPQLAVVGEMEPDAFFPANIVPVEKQFSDGSELLRQNPELLSSGRGRKRPLEDDQGPLHVVMIPPQAAKPIDFDLDAPISPDQRRSPTYAAKRMQQLRRVQAAKDRGARVGGGQVPVDSSVQQQKERVGDSQDRIHVKGGTGKKKALIGVGQPLEKEELPVDPVLAKMQKQALMVKARRRKAAQRMDRAAAAAEWGAVATEGESDGDE